VTNRALQECMQREGERHGIRWKRTHTPDPRQPREADKEKKDGRPKAWEKMGGRGKTLVPAEEWNATFGRTESGHTEPRRAASENVKEPAKGERIRKGKGTRIMGKKLRGRQEKEDEANNKGRKRGKGIVDGLALLEGKTSGVGGKAVSLIRYRAMERGPSGGSSAKDKEFHRRADDQVKGQGGKNRQRTSCKMRAQLTRAFRWWFKKKERGLLRRGGERKRGDRKKAD